MNYEPEKVAWGWERPEAGVGIERFAGEDGFGFLIYWRFDDYWVDVRVFEVVNHREDCGIGFQKDGAAAFPSETTSVLDAEVYAEGHVKWDGCCEIDWGNHHWCGAFWWDRQVRLMRFIHDRAFQLMGRDGEDEWLDGSPTD